MYRFMSFNTTILNSTVKNPNSQVVYQVATGPSTPSITILRDTASRSVALIEWQPSISVEIRDVASKQRTRDWLKVSTDKRFVLVRDYEAAAYILLAVVAT